MSCRPKNDARMKKHLVNRKSPNTTVVWVVAEDDLVVVAFVREYDDPRKPGAKYTTYVVRHVAPQGRQGRRASGSGDDRAASRASAASGPIVRGTL